MPLTYDVITDRLQARARLIAQIAPRSPAAEHARAMLRYVQGARFCGVRCLLSSCDAADHAARAQQLEATYPLPPDLFLEGDEVELVNWRGGSPGRQPGPTKKVQRITPTGRCLVEGCWYSSDGRGRGRMRPWRLRLVKRGLTPFAMALQAIDLALQG